MQRQGRRSALWAAGLALCACHSKVTSASGELRLGGEAIDFGTVFVGYPVQRTVQVTNVAMAPADGQLSVSSTLLSIAPSSLHAAGGETIVATLTFTPTDAGVLSATVTLSSEDQTSQRAVSGVAQLPPSCVGRSCHPSTFDPDAGVCVVTVAPDGSGCADDPCLSGGTCTSGICRGTPRDCGDGNACTADACGDHGCVHVDVSGACPMPGDPCMAAACHADAGCIGVPLGDGAPCGPNDCTHANVCIGGACVARPAPNGSLCAPASICQDAGYCDNGVCVQAPPSNLTPEWIYSPPDSALLSPSQVGIVADDDSNLYFAETHSLGCELVSLTTTATERWRAGIAPNTCRVMAFDQALGQVLVVIDTGALAARDASDGGLRWQVDFAPLTGVAGGSLDTDQVILSGRGSGVPMLVTVVQNSFNSQRTWLGFIDRTSGAVLSFSERPGLENAIGDGTGNFLISIPDGGDLTLTALDSTGALLWSQVANSAPYIEALSGDTVAMASSSGAGQLWSLAGRSPRVSVSAISGEVVADHDTMWTYATSFPSPNENSVAGFDLSSGVLRAAASIGIGQTTALFATDRATVLGVVATMPGALIEVDTRGTTTMSCPVPYFTGATLADGHLYATSLGEVFAYPLPGIRPAATGWSALHGGPHADGQPR